MTKCHACRRESCGRCNCGKEVCHIHDGCRIDRRGTLVVLIPVCMACRWGNA